MPPTILVFGVIFVCMAIALGLSYLASRISKKFWLRLALFVLVAAFSFFLYPTLVGIAVALLTQGGGEYRSATLQYVWPALGGIVAMDFFGMWLLQKMIDSQRAKSLTKG